MDIKEKIMQTADSLPEEIRELDLEEINQVSGGNFGKGCTGTWSDGVSGFSQQCQP